MSFGVRQLAVSLVALSTLALGVGAGAGTTARGPQLTLHWQAPTPSDGKSYAVKAGEPFTLELAATTSTPQLVLVNSRRLPAGVNVTAAFGRPGVATVTWTPTAAQVGEHVLTFTASTRDLPHAYARPRSLLVYVLPESPGEPTKPFPLTGANGMSRWADVWTSVYARTRPSSNVPSVSS